MIEVEKKFILNEETKARLLEGAEFLAEKEIYDEYFDTSDFSLTKKDWWLRSRNGNFELKIAEHQGIDRLVDQYKEVEDEEGIKTLLNLSSEVDLKTSLSEGGFNAFSTYTTIRKKYKKGEFGIDIDITQASNFYFNIAEIELMVEDESKMSEAVEKILSFADSIGLERKRIQGKVAEFLKQLKPDHFKALVEARVLFED